MACSNGNNYKLICGYLTLRVGEILLRLVGNVEGKKSRMFIDLNIVNIRAMLKNGRMSIWA
jgi:hypothetical protein